MKLLVEVLGSDNLQVLTEGEGAEKTYRLKGIFAQSEIKNRNGRIYPKFILEREVNAYHTNKILTKRAVGELDHPASPLINLDRVSHLIESLEWRGNDVFGSAKILDTPMGKIVKVMLKEGIQLGVSSRGLGTVTGDLVNKDYALRAVDIVSDPSAPKAFVEGILENTEYIINGNSVVEVAVDHMKEKLDRQGSKAALDAMTSFLDELKKRL